MQPVANGLLLHAERRRVHLLSGHALALAGEHVRARTCFDSMTGFANDVGLPVEEIDGARGELLGNFPPALTHNGLVNAADAIAKAKRRRP